MGRKCSNRGKRCAEFPANLHEAFMIVREDHRWRMRSRKKPKRRVVGDLAINHRDEFGPAGRLVKARVEILKQTPGDLSEYFEFIKRAQQKSLMEHSRKKRVDDLMPGHVHHCNARFAPAALEIRHNLGLPG